jgi:hypothetical protein
MRLAGLNREQLRDQLRDDSVDGHTRTQSTLIVVHLALRRRLA